MARPAIGDAVSLADVAERVTQRYCLPGRCRRARHGQEPCKQGL